MLFLLCSLNFDFLYAVDNYERLIATIDRIPEEMPQTKRYIEKLDEDIEAQKEAIITGDLEQMAETVRRGAEDTKEGAHTLKGNRKLYKVGDKVAPKELENLAEGFENGTKTAADEYALMGYFDTLVGDALDHPK